MKRLLLLILALLATGCDYPYTERIRQAEAETTRLQAEMKQVETAIPVIEERKQRIRALSDEIEALKAEIAALEKKAKKPK